MKLYEIVNAGAAMRRLMSQEVSLRTAYQLSLLVDRLNPHLSYFDSNRERISALADAGSEELDALLGEDIEMEKVNKVSVRLSENVSLSAADVMHLRKFVDFVEKENG